jgi:hypothetical protein
MNRPVRAIDLTPTGLCIHSTTRKPGTGCDLHRLMLVVGDISALARIKRNLTPRGGALTEVH